MALVVSAIISCVLADNTPTQCPGLPEYIINGGTTVSGGNTVLSSI